MNDRLSSQKPTEYLTSVLESDSLSKVCLRGASVISKVNLVAFPVRLVHSGKADLMDQDTPKLIEHFRLLFRQMSKVLYSFDKTLAISCQRRISLRQIVNSAENSHCCQQGMRRGDRNRSPLCSVEQLKIGSEVIQQTIARIRWRIRRRLEKSFNRSCRNHVNVHPVPVYSDSAKTCADRPNAVQPAPSSRGNRFDSNNLFDANARYPVHWRRSRLPMALEPPTKIKELGQRQLPAGEEV